MWTTTTAARWTGWKVIAIGAFVALGAAVVMSRPVDPWEAHLAEMETQLEAAWKARHPGPPLPAACEHRDDPRAGNVEIDASSDGPELVIASHRLGIAVFAASGKLLAFADPVGCPATPVNSWFNTVLQGGVDDFDGLVVREQAGGCRSTTTATLYRMRGDTLVKVARYHEQVFDQCRWQAEGIEKARWITDIRANQVALTIRFKQRIGADTSDHDCTLRFDGWLTPSCKLLLDLCATDG